jgi:hypothetical protein
MKTRRTRMQRARSAKEIWMKYMFIFGKLDEDDWELDDEHCGKYSSERPG